MLSQYAPVSPICLHALVYYTSQGKAFNFLGTSSREPLFQQRPPVHVAVCAPYPELTVHLPPMVVFQEHVPGTVATCWIYHLDVEAEQGRNPWQSSPHHIHADHIDHNQMGNLPLGL